MASSRSVGVWPQYTYVEPQIYTRAKMRLVGIGTYIPGGEITNEFFAYLSERLGDPRSCEALEQATGMLVRRARSSSLHFCRTIAGADAPGLIDPPTPDSAESITDMAVIAAERALASAGREASEIDAVLATSFTDNNVFPTVAGMVQMRLGCRQVRSSTLRGACACETETFQMAAEMLAASTARLVLIVASDGILTNALHILDWKASSIFGEGAAAFLLERGTTDDDETFTINGYDARQGPALFYQAGLRKDAREMADMDHTILQLYQQGDGEALQKMLLQYTPGYAHMNGFRVYQTAPRAMAECVDALCRHADLTPDDLAHIVPHQPNAHMVRRIGDLLIQEYGWPETVQEKLFSNVRSFGNLSNASIGVALVELLRLGRLRPGQWIALPAVGGGMHYGGCLLRYHDIKDVEQSIQPHRALFDES